MNFRVATLTIVVLTVFMTTLMASPLSLSSSSIMGRLGLGSNSQGETSSSPAATHSFPKKIGLAAISGMRAAFGDHCCSPEESPPGGDTHGNNPNSHAHCH